MKALVTGGAGFIGSALSRKLADHEYQVTILDDFSTGRQGNVEALANRPNVEIIEGSVLDEDLVGCLVSGSRVVFHLASTVGVRLVLNDPIKTIESGITGTRNVLASAVRHDARVLLTSTSEVYGAAGGAVFHEGDRLILGEPKTTRWTYSAMKITCELLARAYFAQLNLPVTTVRLFNVIGPKQSSAYGMVVPTLVSQALRGDDLTVYGTGTQTRTFTWVADVVDALIALVSKDDTVGEVYNLGGDEELSILELACLIKEVTGSDSRVVFVPYHQAYGDGYEDTMRRVPNLDKIRAAIKYKPSMSVREMVQAIAAAS